MAKLIEMFGFEQNVFHLGHSRFRPLKDAVDRWSTTSSDGRFSGNLACVLYELRDGRFVFIEYPDCQLTVHRRFLRSIEIWVSHEPPSLRIVGPQEAVMFLQRGHFDLPASLEKTAALMSAERSQPVIRPQSLWAGRNHQVRRNPAPPSDLLAYVESLMDSGTSAVQAIRKWAKDHGGDDVNVREFVAKLLAEFKVDPLTWNGTPGGIPPETVSLLDLVWPANTHRVQENLGHMRSLLDAPVAILNRVCPLNDPKEPTSEERSEARRTLIEALPDIEATIGSIRKQLAAIRQAQEQAAAAQAAKSAVPKPSENDFIVYQIQVNTGMSQKQVASEFTRTMRLPMDQGQVSKALKRVHVWIDAGNMASPIELPDPRDATPFNPEVLNRGQRKDGRSPSQRGKCDPE